MEFNDVLVVCPACGAELVEGVLRCAKCSTAFVGRRAARPIVFDIDVTRDAITFTPRGDDGGE